MKRFLTTAVVAAAAALVLAACGDDDGGDVTTSPGTGASGDTVSVADVDGVGMVLVDANGQALYTPDQESDGRIVCTDACLSFWMPLEAGQAPPTAAPGVADLGVLERPDGTRQVTDDGRPLYTFSEDSPGAVTGDGFTDDFGGAQLTWHAVLADGTSAAGNARAPGGTGY